MKKEKFANMQTNSKRAKTFEKMNNLHILKLLIGALQKGQSNT